MTALRLHAQLRRYPSGVMLALQLVGVVLYPFIEPTDAGRAGFNFCGIAVYLSFALLSSTGIGDVVPLTTHTRALASIEMFVGVMYIAAIVSRPVGRPLPNR